MMGKSGKTKIIAEIGENHHGDWDIAKAMFEQAAINGADYLKIQSYTADIVPADDPEYDWFARVAVPDEVHFELKELAEKLGAEFLSAPFSVERAAFLVEKLRCDSVKVASGAMSDFEMLDYINGKSGQVKRVYLSTGQADIQGAREALSHLDSIADVAVLHCVSLYPTPPEKANLARIAELRREFPDHPTGYSDHVPGMNACLAAVALGAEVIEKHFTLSKHLPGTDHEGSMTPDELRRFVVDVEEIEKMTRRYGD